MIKRVFSFLFSFRNQIFALPGIIIKKKRELLIGALVLCICPLSSNISQFQPEETVQAAAVEKTVEAVDSMQSDTTTDSFLFLSDSNLLSGLPYMTIPAVGNEDEKIITVPYISQENLLPTGCEIVSTIMLLKFYDYTVSVNDFVDRYLTKQDLQVHSDGQLYGPHPSSAFIGSPYRGDGLGCYAPVILNSLNQILSDRDTATDLTGTPIDTLIDRFIKNDTPVLIWASMNMMPLKNGCQWIIEDTGEEFTWLSGEHCLVLVGYDEDNYYFNDPYHSNGLKGYDKETVRQRYMQMGQQSLAILRE